MDLEIELERLEAGEIMLDEARAALGKALESPDEESAADVYRALRGWTGRALRSSHLAEELRAWHELIDGAAARLERLDRNWALRLDVLKELVFERIGMAENRSPAEIIRRRHARPLLAKLADAPGRTLARAELLDALELQQANLTRVCNMLVDAGMIRRHSDGASASFELALAGLTALTQAATEDASTLVAEVAEASAIRASATGSAWSGVADLDAHRKRRGKSRITDWIEHDEPLPPMPVYEKEAA